MSEYEVALYIHGPITVKGRITLREPKGQNPDDPFHSDISLTKTQYGVLATLTARTDADSTNAKDEMLATKAALHFLGQTLDVLALDIRRPLYLSLLDRPKGWPKEHRQRLFVAQDSWHSAFNGSRVLGERHTADFLRALSWYRKGQYTEDPLDKFLAFWNSIEGVATKYAPRDNCTGRMATKCYVWESFKLVWGRCEQWPVIPGESGWIDEYYNTRKDIAHGAMSVSIRRIETVLERLDSIEAVAHRFLSDWRAQQIRLVR